MRFNGVIGHSRKHGKMFPCVKSGLRYLYIAISAICDVILLSCAGTEKTGERRSYGSDPASTKYAPLDQINGQQNKAAIRPTELGKFWAQYKKRLPGRPYCQRPRGTAPVLDPTE